MPDHRDAELVSRVADEFQLIEGPRRDFATVLGRANWHATDVHLDPVDTHFDLFMYFFDDVVRGMNDTCVTPCAFVGKQPCGGAADTINQYVAARSHARSFDDATLDGIAEINPDIEDAIRIKEACKTCAQYFLGVNASDQRRQTITSVEEQLVIAIGVVETDVAVAVDHAREHSTARRVYLCDRGVSRGVTSRIGSHRDNLLVLNENVSLKRLGTRPIDNEAIFNQGI